jgi:hypothetical protein
MLDTFCRIIRPARRLLGVVEASIGVLKGRGAARAGDAGSVLE